MADAAADRRLVPVSSLPPSSRALFPFASFNRMQSECFDEAYGSDRSMVVSAPTGSGKTVLLELALARLWSSGHDVVGAHSLPGLVSAQPFVAWSCSSELCCSQVSGVRRPLSAVGLRRRKLIRSLF